jgi:anti-sigma factor RsiW
VDEREPASHGRAQPTDAMGRIDTITDADLLDYMEGRLSRQQRARVETRIARDPALAERCQRVSEQTLNVRMLRAVLPVESVPEEWLAILSARERR